MGRIGSTSQPKLSVSSVATPQTDSRRGLVASNLWLHVGFIGASVLAAGLVQLFDGEPGWPWALPMALVGGLVAAASWRRSLDVLEDAGRAASAAADAPKEPRSHRSDTRLPYGAIGIARPSYTAIKPKARR